MAYPLPVSCLGLLLAFGSLATAAEPGKPDDFFAPTKVWQFHIEMTAKEYEAMQPAAGGGFGFPGGFPGAAPAPAPVKKPGDRETHRSVFGTDFPVAHATISSGAETVEDVAIRYKGNSTYLATARNLKRSLKLDIDHFEKDKRFLGAKTINLHCGAHDPSKIREALAYESYRAAGVPAPRTSFAEVTLTVPGKFNKEYLGLYTLTEQVGKPFLKAHYESDQGLLMKPEKIRGLDYLGDDWAKYKDTYQPKRDATPAEIARVTSFLKLVNQGSDDAFAKGIAGYLDVDAFLKFLTATAMIANLDSFFTLGHNYYLYLHPQTKKFHFIPWDTDLALGNFAFFGTAEQQMTLSLNKPYAQNKLADRLLALKDVKAKYQTVLKDMAAATFAKTRLMKQLEALESVVKAPMQKEAKAVAARKEQAGMGGFGGPFTAKPPELKAFFEKRVESIAAQLDGKSQGYVPQGFGVGGGFGPPPNPIAKTLFDAMDTDKDGKIGRAEYDAAMKRFFDEWDKDKNGTLDPKELAEGLQKAK